MKFNNNNQAVIKKITKRSLKRNRVRNIFAVAAIILTTFMISTVFGIGISFIKNYQIMNNRLMGTLANTELANPTDSQVSKLKKLKYFNSVGYEIKAGKVCLNNEDSINTSIAMKYLSSEDYEKQNEIMISEIGLKFLNKKNVKIGDTINLKYRINDKEYTSDFVISGTFKTFGIVQETGYIYVSKEYVNKNKLSLEDNGELLMNIKSKYKNNANDTLKHEISLKDKQKFKFSFEQDQDNQDSVVVSLALASIISLFVILSGYLLIYNILYIAVVKDTNFYGLLKTIGTSPSQIKKIVKGQSLRLSLIGIPIGLLLSILVSFVVVPVAIKGLSGGTYYGSAMPSEISFNPLIFIIAALFSLLTVAISCRKPTNGGKLHKMAWYKLISVY